MILGVITGKAVVQNAHLILREFGARVLLGCLVAVFHRKPRTFLQIVFRKWN